jgi:UDP-glucose 6-dehydrogenase
LARLIDELHFAIRREAARAYATGARGLNDPGLTYATSQTTALDNADALVIVTEWKEFRSPDFDNLKARSKPR